MRLTENEAIQLLQCMLGGIGQKSLAAKMGMDVKTISDALNDSTRLYRDPTRDATKEFFDNCLAESRTNVSAYIASAYEWLEAKEPSYSNEILEAIAEANPTMADGKNVDWSTIKSADELESILKLLPSLDKAATALRECVQIESWLEHKVRINRTNHSERRKQGARINDLHQYDKETRALEAARAKRAEILPVEHVKRSWLIERILHSNGSVVVIEAPAGYGKTTLLDSIALNESFVAASLQCKWDDPVRSEQMSILDALNDRLSSSNETYKDAIEHMSKAAESPSDKVNSMIAAMQKAGSGSQPVQYIVLDALDELKDSRHLLNLLDRLAMAGGYGWVKVVCSTRQWEAGREGKGYCVVRPLEEPMHNNGDIEAYALKRLSAIPNSDGCNAAAIASTIASRSKGIFQYAVIVLDALCDGIVNIGDIDELPSDIFSLYDWYLARYLDSNPSSDRDALITILNMVAASKAPVPEEIITCALSLGSRRWDKTKESLDRFLVCARTKTGTLYSLFHKSFSDYLFSSRHGGKSAEEEGVAFLAMGCYRAKCLDRLSYWASDYIQVYLAWLLYRANNNALLDIHDFNLRSARFEVLHDISYANSCLDLFEPAQDVIAFRAPAREEVIAWSAMQIFDNVLSQEEEQTGNPRDNAPKSLLSDWLFSCNHYIFVLVSTSRFDEALQVGNAVISSMGEIDIQLAKPATGIENEIAQEYALLYETIAYDVLTVGQPSNQEGAKVTDYYDKAISIYSSQEDVEGFLKATCNKALYEAEHVNAKDALSEIRSLVYSCGLQESLLANPDNNEFIEVSSLCRTGVTARIKAESAFNHMNNLGYCLTLAGDELEGLRLFGICEVLAFDETGVDRGGPYSEHDKAELFHLEAIAFYRLGEYARVIECERKAIPGLQEAWGLDSPKLCGPYNLLGSTSLSLGRIPEAITLFEKALSIASNNWPTKHSRLVNIRLNLARAEIRNAQNNDSPSGAKAALERAASQIDSVWPDESSVTELWKNPDSGFLKAQLVMSEYLEADGRLDEACSVCSRVVDAYRARDDSDRKSLGSSLVSLARLQIKLDRNDQARAALTEGMALLRETLNTFDGNYSNHPIWQQATSLAELLG